MTDFSRNNLDLSTSAYLYDHRENPIHWQQWSQEVLDYARQTGKILFVSVGYSTCHWCHVMADGAFSDIDCAQYINTHFMPIKIDREARPDIDQFMMEYLVSSTGSGGWPLNVFLSPDLEPFFAMTFGSPEPRGTMPAFLDILQQVKSFFSKHKASLQEFTPSFTPPQAPVSSFDHIDQFLVSHMDQTYGGFEQHQKFPPHTSLLYALNRSAEGSRVTDKFITTTLDAVAKGGLHDHLQGGFFRYCTDPKWEIPHFEKMLYDQAMLLWSFSLASRIFSNELYRECALGILRCLKETFLDDDGLYCAGHDADTDHQEGGSYTWDMAQLKEVLSQKSFQSLADSFSLPQKGNFEGKIHLTRKSAAPLSADARNVCDRLLLLRKGRKQPAADTKKLTEWNALTGIALLQAYRSLAVPEALHQALSIRNVLLEGYVTPSGGIIRGKIGEAPMKGKFLEDHAALLLFLTYCCEEDRNHEKELLLLSDSLKSFKNGRTWVRSREQDFLEVPAPRFDSPSPSPYSLAQFALSRASMVTGNLYPVIDTGLPGAHDFTNYAALQTGGHAYLVSSPEHLPWSILPVNSIQVKGTGVSHCFGQSCRDGLPVNTGNGIRPGVPDQ